MAAPAGHNLLHRNQTLPKVFPSRRESALFTVNSRTTTLQGPVPLVQGGLGAIIRAPIFIEGSYPSIAPTWRRPEEPYDCAQCNDLSKNQIFWG